MPPTETEEGMAVCEVPDSEVCFEYRTYSLSLDDAFQSTFTSNWSTSSFDAVVPR